jgi:hypothetical protein
VRRYVTRRAIATPNDTARIPRSWTQILPRAGWSHFRCYLLNAADNIVSVNSVQAQDDVAAIEMAGQLMLSKHSAFAAIEVWDCARLVGKITSPTDKPCLDSLLKIS